MITKLQPTEKIQVMTNGFNECLRNHLCGNYMDMSDIEGLEYPTIEWDIDARKYNYKFLAYTEYGLFKFYYDFDFDFDMNLQSFYERLVEYLYKKVQRV